MGPSVGCRRRNRSLSVPSAWFGLAVSPSRLSPSQPLHYSGTCSRHHFSKVNTSARGRRSAGRRGGRDVRAVESTAHPSGGESAACTQAALASDPFGHVTGSGCARTPAWEVKARVLKEEVRCRRSPVSRVPGPVDLAEVSRRTGGAGIPHHRIGWLGRCPLAPPRRQSFLWLPSNLSGQLLDQGSGRRTRGGAGEGALPPGVSPLREAGGHEEESTVLTALSVPDAAITEKEGEASAPRAPFSAGLDAHGRCLSWNLRRNTGRKRKP